jgi:hypothetical protein
MNPDWPDNIGTDFRRMVSSPLAPKIHHSLFEGCNSRHHVHNTSWGIVDFDDQTGAVFVQQKWLYHWRLSWEGVTAPWTYYEKRDFHATIDKQIWGTWSNRIRLSLTGTSKIARRFASQQVGMNFDVKWALSPPIHWTVTAWKMPRGASPTSPHRSFVNTIRKVIELNTADLAPRGASTDAGVSTPNFRTAPHGHAFLSGDATSNPDEYVNTSGNVADTSSIMNIGREVRQRHLTAVITELNKLVPNLTFSIATPVQ